MKNKLASNLIEQIKYQIISDYPNSPFFINDIIYLPDNSELMMDGEIGLKEYILDKYPNIFKKLEE